MYKIAVLTISTTSGNQAEYSVGATAVEEVSSARIPIALLNPLELSSFQRLLTTSDLLEI